MTSARPIGVCAAVKTAVLNEDSVRLEVKLDLVLTQIATLSSQFDSKMPALRQEVWERYQKLTDELTEDAENREKPLDAKLKIVVSNVALQQEQLDTLITDVSRLNMFIETVKNVDFRYISKEIPNLVLGHKKFHSDIVELNTLANKNLERIRQRTRLYGVNFRMISEKFK